MPIPSTIESLSTTAASNGPSGSDQRNTADDGLRTAYAFIAQLVNQGSDLASASTITPPSTGWQFDVTGTTAITTIASTNSWNGRLISLQFDGALTLTHSSNLALPGSANITTAAGDVAFFQQRGSGAWRCVNYQRADGTLVNTGVLSSTYTPTTTDVSNFTNSSTSLSIYQRMPDGISVSGKVAGSSGIAGLAKFRVTLPVASSFTSAVNCHGLATAVSGSVCQAGIVQADATNDAAEITFGAHTNAAWEVWYEFMYRVL